MDTKRFNETMVRYLEQKKAYDAAKQELGFIKLELEELLGDKLEIVTNNYKLAKSTYKRESFQLKKALEVIDRRSLAKFITVSDVTTLKVKAL